METMQNEVEQPLPVRMLNEFAYCPRLIHLMHVDGRWDGKEFTDDGQAVPVDTKRGFPPDILGGC